LVEAVELPSDAPPAQQPANDGAQRLADGAHLLVKREQLPVGAEPLAIHVFTSRAGWIPDLP